VQVKGLLTAIPRTLFSNAPIDAQLIITRRCNLSCGYCAEYDNFSEPVPLELLKERIDALHELHSANITLLGGEPLMHPDIAEIVRYAGRKANVSIVTNGFLLRNGVIEQLNQAGLNNLTVSVDTLKADRSRYIQKSFQSLKTRLQRLQNLARFDVHVTAVLCDSSKDDFRELVREVQGMRFRMSINLLHNSKGYIGITGPEYLDLFEEFYREGKPFTFLDYEYGKALLSGETPDWVCKTGSRYLYVDEHGDVQLCASQLGRKSFVKPIVDYTSEDLDRNSKTAKGCEKGCSVGCAYRCSVIDNDKPTFVRAIVKGGLRGTIFDNGRAKKRAPRLQPEVALSDDV
jgi:MoaA/NifB/PqqE/SkfB family radical SAM enzyme